MIYKQRKKNYVFEIFGFDLCFFWAFKSLSRFYQIGTIVFIHFKFILKKS